MIRVRFFGLVRLDLKTEEVMVDAKNVSQVFDILAKKFPEMTAKKFKENVIFLNGKMIYRRKFRTKLQDGDEIMIMSPASGG